jgi:hypothetical protein
LSVLAVVVSFYQARIAEKQAHASVWPYLSIGYNVNDGSDAAGFTWTVDNNGLGPAILESVEVTVDGVPRQGWADVTAAIGLVPGSLRTTSSLNGRVLPPSINRETTIDAIHLPTLADARLFYRARDRIKMSICYCSVYDECWIVRSAVPKVERVARCETAGTVQFRN